MSISEIRPRARYCGEEIYFDDLAEFGVGGVRDILVMCDVAARRAALDAFWLRDQLMLTRNVTSNQNTINRKNLLAIRARFEAERETYRSIVANQPIPR